MEKKFEEPQSMKELHEIREEHYEATKDMNFDELMKSIEAEALKIMKEYNLNFKIGEKH